MTRISQVDLPIGAAEWHELEDVFAERWLTEGPKTKAFERQLSERFDWPHLAFAPNGTLGLFLALSSLKLKPGSEVILPSFTFYGSATAVLFAGLKPVFVDVNEETFCVEADAIEAAINDKTGAIMPVHIYGQCCEMGPIMALAQRNNLAVVEDAAQALGVTYNGKPAGTFGDLGVVSFFSDKVLTMGEGAVIFSQEDRIETLRLMRNQGRPSSGTFVHPEIGMNFRITDLQAAVGLSQLRKFGAIVEKRLELSKIYRSRLEGVGDLRFMKIYERSNWVPFRFPVRTSQQTKLCQHLEAAGVQTRGFFYPMHLQPRLRTGQRLPVSEKLSAEGICLPVHWHISNENVDYICDRICEFFSGS